MSGNIRELSRNITRRKGRLVITITPEGIQLRGYRCSARRKLVTWEQIASLADAGEAGTAELVRLKAVETKS